MGDKGIGKILAISMFLVIVGSSVALITSGIAVTDNDLTNGQIIKIGDIKANPWMHVEEYVTICGEYQGWQSEEGEGPPVTRSDWIIRDGTGEIYVTGMAGILDPLSDLGRVIQVYGIVKMNERGDVYIEAQAVSEEVDCDIEDDQPTEVGRKRGADVALNPRSNFFFCRSA